MKNKNILTFWKLLFLNIITLNMYSYYYTYKTWWVIKNDEFLNKKTKDLKVERPFWRMFFSIFYNFTIIKHSRKLVEKKGLYINFNDFLSSFFGILSLLLVFLANLFDGYNSFNEGFYFLWSIILSLPYTILYYHVLVKKLNIFYKEAKIEKNPIPSLYNKLLISITGTIIFIAFFDGFLSVTAEVVQDIDTDIENFEKNLIIKDIEEQISLASFPVDIDGETSLTSMKLNEGKLEVGYFSTAYLESINTEYLESITCSNPYLKEILGFGININLTYKIIQPETRTFLAEITKEDCK